MAYVDINDDRDENSELSSIIRTKTNSMRGHVPAPYFSFDRTETANRPVCMICSMEEMAKAQVLKLPRSKTKIEIWQDEPIILLSGCMIIVT